MSKCIGVCKLNEKKVCVGCFRTIDEELETAKAMKETETLLRKQLAQLRMARATLIAMGAFTLAMFLIDVERVKALSDISNLFYLSGAGIVGAYMGTTAWMSKK
jgi:predicted Fe-S protein YdhL (DUF1289 family)